MPSSLTQPPGAPSYTLTSAFSLALQVILYDGLMGVRRTIGRFKDKAYCGTLRSDGKMLAAGGEDGLVQVRTLPFYTNVSALPATNQPGNVDFHCISFFSQLFDSNSRSLLRQLKGHRRPARSVAFAPDRLHLLTGGDDATVRYWDISSGEQVSRLDGHSDYVRAIAASPTSQELWATGG